MHSNTINQFCSQLIPYQYVSFDIFDTLIFRTVSDFRVVHQMNIGYQALLDDK